MFRLFIDKQHQHLGKDVFDKDRPGHLGEAGYKGAMLKAFEYVKETMGRRIDADYLIALHAKCTEGVKAYKYVPGSYGYDYVSIDEGFKNFRSFGFDFCKISLEAIDELEKEKLLIQSDKPRADYLSTYHDEKIYSGYTDNVTEAQARDKVNAFCNRCYKELETAQDKMIPMIRLCGALEIYHVFDDGNGRMLYALKDKMLMENDFDPAILDDPYIFDGYFSEREMVEKIKEEVGAFKELKVKA